MNLGLNRASSSASGSYTRFRLRDSYIDTETGHLSPALQLRKRTAVPETLCVRAQPLIAVRDVRASSRWYCELLGFDSLPEHPHRDRYERLQCAGQLILQLHAWDAEEHPNLTNRDAAAPGHGVLLWFEVTNFEEVVGRARALQAEVILEPHVNPRPQHREMWLRDLDGYVVVVAGADGEVKSE